MPLADQTIYNFTRGTIFIIFSNRYKIILLHIYQNDVASK